jgi:hypothetical protein
MVEDSALDFIVCFVMYGLGFVGGQAQVVV